MAKNKIIEEQEYTELRELLQHQCIDDKYNDILREFVSREKSKPNYCEALLIWDIFNYGRICGKRDERARKEPAQEPEQRGEGCNNE